MLNCHNTGLIVVDIQGKLATLMDGGEQYISYCHALIAGAKELNLPIIWLEQNPEKLGNTHPNIASLLDGIKPITKYTFDACREPAFLTAIAKENKPNWLVCGIEAHICVYQTAASLLQNNYQVHLVNDCIASRKSANKQLAVNKLQHLGARITGLEMALFELVKDCRDERFKTILNLIK